MRERSDKPNTLRKLEKKIKFVARDRRDKSLPQPPIKPWHMSRHTLIKHKHESPKEQKPSREQGWRRLCFPEPREAVD